MDDHHGGLQRDLALLPSRRRTLGLLASAGAVAVVACDGGVFARGQPDVVGRSADGAECVGLPTETAGPFPADGSNRAHGTLANVLANSGIVRRDMRPSLDGPAIAAGVPMTLEIALVDVGRACSPLAAHAIYLWHCDAEGRYSLYDIPGVSYLRAVGVTCGDGKVKFTTVMPGCYDGRCPHMHFEVYSSLAAATSYKNRVLTSQLALPSAICDDVYRFAPAAYVDSFERHRRSRLANDMIFADNTEKQLAAQTIRIGGSPEAGLTGTVVIGL